MNYCTWYPCYLPTEAWVLCACTPACLILTLRFTLTWQDNGLDTEGSFKAWWKDNLDPSSMAATVKEIKVRAPSGVSHVVAVVGLLVVMACLFVW